MKRFERKLFMCVGIALLALVFGLAFSSWQVIQTTESYLKAVNYDHIGDYPLYISPQGAGLAMIDDAFQIGTVEDIFHYHTDRVGQSYFLYDIIAIEPAAYGSMPIEGKLKANRLHITRMEMKGKLVADPEHWLPLNSAQLVIDPTRYFQAEQIFTNEQAADRWLRDVEFTVHAQVNVYDKDRLCRPTPADRVPTGFTVYSSDRQPWIIVNAEGESTIYFLFSCE